MYTIPFKGLSLGSHTFDWTINGTFFAGYEMSEISDACIDVHVEMVKHTRFLELTFILDGWAEVMCDRCLDPLKLDIASEAQLYVKFDNNAAEDDSEDNDVVVVSYDEDYLDVNQYLYEYAHLSLPIRRVHPDDENGHSTCNAAMIAKLEQYIVVEDKEQTNSDPRWDQLKNIID